MTESSGSDIEIDYTHDSGSWHNFVDVEDMMSLAVPRQLTPVVVIPQSW